jgi:hypothetical protein
MAANTAKWACVKPPPPKPRAKPKPKAEPSAAAAAADADAAAVESAPAARDSVVVSLIVSFAGNRISSLSPSPQDHTEADTQIVPVQQQQEARLDAFPALAPELKV